MNHRARGFTLLEVLLATTVLAIGLALALATLRAAGVSVERAEALSAREEHLRAASGFLRRRLGSALALGFGQDPDSGRMLRFIGEPERIAFVAELPPYLGRGGPGLHEITLQHAADGRAWLGVRFAAVSSGRVIDADPPRAPEVLAEEIRSFRVRYRSRDLPGQPGTWSEHWDNVEALPLQVEIAIADAAAGDWPLLLVTLPQAGDLP